MRVECSACGKHLGDKPAEGVPDDAISHGLCEPCAHRFLAQVGMSLQSYLDGLSVPVAMVGPEGAIGALNPAACEILGMTSHDAQGLAGGDVFECEHSFSTEGCGRTIHCSGCTIRNTVMDTRCTGLPHSRVPATLRRSTPTGGRDHELLISTTIEGGVVFLQIDEMSVS